MLVVVLDHFVGELGLPPDPVGTRGLIWVEVVGSRHLFTLEKVLVSLRGSGKVDAEEVVRHGDVVIGSLDRV